jgi:hypothetical protein
LPALRLKGAAFQDVRLDARPGGAFGVRLEIDGVPIAFELNPHSLRAAVFRVLSCARDGVPVDVSPPAPRTYRGVAAGDAGTRIAGTIFGGQLRAVVQRPDGRLFGVEPLSIVDPAADRAVHAVYGLGDIEPGDWKCATHGAVHPADAADPGASPGVPGCGRLCQIAFDADYEYYDRLHGSVDEVVGDIEMILNLTDLIYRRDLRVTYELTTVIVRTDPEDPYTTYDPYALLDQFTLHWNQAHGDVERDVAHLMTGRELSGGIIGIANVAVICQLPIGYGISQSLFSPNLVERVTLTTHEVAHNWGALHCDGDPDCYIMCSSLSGCTGIHTRFGSRSIAAMTEHHASRTCLDDGGPLRPWATPDEIAALRGEAATADVLANDLSVTCRAIALAAFDDRTAAGGSVTLLPGGGAGGRDALRYTPPGDFTGTDAFAYTVADDGGLDSTSTVSVAVLELREPDAPSAVLGGVEARYVEGGVVSLPNFGALFPAATEIVPTVDFPSTIRQFAGSGLADLVGATFEGSLVIGEPGVYTFYTESDDGSRLYVDGERIVENDGPHWLEERSGSVTLDSGPHAVRIEYFEKDIIAALVARIEGEGLEKQVIPAGMWEAPGVTATYYDLTGKGWIPNFDVVEPFGEGVEPDVDFPLQIGTFAGSGRDANVAAAFTGFIEVPAAGVYRLYVASDDGSALYLGERKVIDNDGIHEYIERGGFAALEAGRHATRVEYFQLDGATGLVVSIEGGDLAKQPIPASRWFRRDPDTPVDPGDDGAVVRPAFPVALRVHPCAPNPFGSATRLAFELPRPARVGLSVYDASGRLVRRLLDPRSPVAGLAAGAHRVLWDGRDRFGAPVGTGVYFLRVEAGDEAAATRVQVVR